MDNFDSLWNRLLNRAPALGPVLAQQLINDSWHTLQARREWSWRRRSSTFVPPLLYQTGTVSTNVGAGSPTLITGSGTSWTSAMVGRQIRLNGLLNPYYDIVEVLSATSLVIGQPWAGDDLSGSVYQILQVWYPAPSDFQSFYTIWSPKDAYQLWTSLTENDLSKLDPQRTNQGQTYAAVFKDYSAIVAGTVGAVIQVSGSGDSPVSGSSLGFTFPAAATYIIQIVGGGASGVATYQWKRSGQSVFTGPVTTDVNVQDLSDGVQVYWPVGTYVANDVFIVNATPGQGTGVPRYELWPGPTFPGYVYPFIYITRETDLTTAAPALPPGLAVRGEVILELALEKASSWPGADKDHPNIYFNPNLTRYHAGRASDMLIDLERNDEETGVTTIDYKTWPFFPGPWLDGAWQQRHAPFLIA